MALLDIGYTGLLVKILQSYLKVINFYDGEISGTFDDETQKAVDSFKKAATITDKEGVDETTWTALVEQCEGIVKGIQSAKTTAIQEIIWFNYTAVEDINKAKMTAIQEVSGAKDTAVAELQQNVESVRDETVRIKESAVEAQKAAEIAALRASASASAVRARAAARRAVLGGNNAIATYNRIKEMKAVIESLSASAQISAALVATTSPGSSIAQASDNAAKAAKAKEQDAQTELDKTTAALSQAQEQAKAADLAALEAQAQEKQALDATETTVVKTAAEETATKQEAAKAAEIEVSKALAIVQGAETIITPIKAEVETLAKVAAEGLPPDQPRNPTPVELPNWNTLWQLFNQKTEPSAPPHPNGKQELPPALTNLDELEYLFELNKSVSTPGGKVKEAAEQVTEVKS